MKKNINFLLKKHSLRPSKGLGQNFLINRGVIKKIIETSEIKPEDIILEIGPGLGTLTVELAKKAKKIIAVEKDPKMVDILKETLESFSNVEIIQEDILSSALNISMRAISGYKMVANLPYYIVAPVIKKFLEEKNLPEKMILMVQKEVGQRICAKPPKMSLLTVSVQFYAKADLIFHVSKKSFWPEPKVDSAVIKIVPHPFSAKNSRHFRERFFKIVKAGFSQPRKQLLNNLSKGLKLNKEKIKSWLLKNKINPGQRAETLSVKDWLKLTQF